MPSNIALHRLSTSWKLSLDAGNKAPRTIETYLDALRLFIEWLDANQRPTIIAEITRADIAGFVADQVARHKPSTASVRYRGLRVFFNWAVNDEHIERSAMDRMSPPIVPETPVPILTEDDLRQVLKVCDGKSFDDRRDAAIIRLLYDTGIRRVELAGLEVDDIDLDHRVVTVLGKGRRPRSVPFGATTARAVDRWLLAREKHPLAATATLWLGLGGRGFNDQGCGKCSSVEANRPGYRICTRIASGTPSRTLISPKVDMSPI